MRITAMFVASRWRPIRPSAAEACPSCGSVLLLEDFALARQIEEPPGVGRIIVCACGAGWFIVARAA